MYKILIFIVSLVSFSLFSQNQSTIINGKVIDEDTGEPIVNAQIFISDLKISTETNVEGMFFLKNISRNYLAQISAKNYANKIITIKPTDENIIITLTHAATELQYVVVTGLAKATEIRKTSIPIAVISSAFLKQNPSTNIIETIAKIPGISSLSSGPNVSKPYIRGLGFNRVLILYDGIRQDGQQWGEEHGVEIDQNNVDRVEVIKGPASLMYGSDALAGVINFLPEKAPSVGEIKGELITEYLTNNLGISGTTNIAGNKNGYIWNLRLSHKQAASYKNSKDERVFGTKYKETDLASSMSIHKKWGYSSLNFSIFDDTQEVPLGDRDEITGKFIRQISDTETEIVSPSVLRSYTIDKIHQRVQHYTLYSNTHLNFSESQLSIKLSYQKSKRKEFSHPNYPSIAGLYLTLNNYTYDIKYFFPKLNNIEIVSGINGMYQNNSNTKATEFIIPNYNSIDVGPFIHIKKEIGKWAISTGIRYDLRKIIYDELYTLENANTGLEMITQDRKNGTQQFEKGKNTFSGVSGSIGATYNLNKSIALKANIGRGYRAPNITEIAAKGVHPSTDYQQLAGDNIKAEQNIQSDLGFFYYKPHFTASVEVFYNYLENFIFNQKNKDANGEDEIFIQNGKEYQVYKFQQTKARLYGGEASIDFHPKDWIHFKHSISLLYGDNLGGNEIPITYNNKYLPLISPLHSNSELRFNFTNKIGIFNNSYVKLGMQYFDKQHRVFTANDTETPSTSYMLLDAAVGGDILNKNKKTYSMSITVNNLANVAYQSHLSRLKYMSIYDIGRNITFKLIFSF